MAERAVNMPNVCSPRADLIFRSCLILVALGALGMGITLYAVSQPEHASSLGWAQPQPVMFSHAHHVGVLGLDCRYCHASAAESDFAGMPTAETCMNCHLQLYTTAPMLEPVRDAWSADVPLRWNRVYRIPDFISFSHKVHVLNGVACVSCHGRMDAQPLTRQETPLTMRWCIECHRHPAERLVDLHEEFDPGAVPGSARDGAERVDREEILTNCSACHY
jgi:hypothetical protein